MVQLCQMLCDPMDCSPQDSLSMEFSRQEDRSGFPFPTPGDLPNPGTDQNHPKEKEMQEGKVIVWGGFTNSRGKKRAKGKGERERYTQLNAQFQGIARRNKKAFLNEQCKETEEDNRIGKTTDLFKKIGAIKGICHARMGMMKDRNGKDLKETEEIKKRWQDYTEKLYKMVLKIWMTMVVQSLT